MIARPAVALAVALQALPAPTLAQTGAERYRESCDGGDAETCVALGLMYELGAGVERDAARAAALYERACNGDEPRGCTNLALLHERGTGVPRDPERAAALHRRACDLGEPLACDLLGPAERRAAAAAGGYSKSGRIEDATTGAPLPEALVEIPALGIRVVSDLDGRVSLGRVPAGSHGLIAERFGYVPVDGLVDVPGNAEFIVRLEPARIDDPLAPGRIVGRVIDASSRGALADVEVDAGGGAARTLSNQSGSFTLREVQPGLVEVRLGRLGYGDRSTWVVVQPGGTVELTAMLSTEPIELDPVEVTVRSAQLDRSGFFRRQARGLGTHFTRQDVERIQPMMVADLLRRVPGVMVRSMLEGSFAFSRRGASFSRGPCMLPIYIDGMRAPDTNLDFLAPEWIEAMEVYSGVGTPIEYGDCGVILIWTNIR